MTWVRLDDRFDDNAKVNEVSNAATGVFTKGLTWSARNEKDGKVPRGVALKLAGPDGADVISELLDAKLWVEVEGGYCAPDFLEFNPSAEEVRARRAKRAEAGKRGAATRWRDESGGESHGKCLASAMANADQVPWQIDGKPMPPYPVSRSTRTPSPDPAPPTPPTGGAGDSGEPSGVHRAPVLADSERPLAAEVLSVFAKRAGRRIGTLASADDERSLQREVARYFATGEWAMPDVEAAADWVAAGGLAWMTRRRPDVRWLTDGGGLAMVLERSRAWHRDGRPRLDPQGQPVRAATGTVNEGAAAKVKALRASMAAKESSDGG